MGINKLSGAPWHVERVHLKDGDERRHKCRCKYYSKNGCSINIVCHGSAHCKDYREKEVTQKVEKKKESHILKQKSNIKPILVNGKTRYTAIVVETNNETFEKIMNEVDDKGFYNMNVLGTNWKETGFQVKSFENVFLKYKDNLVMCKIKNLKITVINSGNVETMSFTIVGRLGTHPLVEKRYITVGYGDDDYYGKVRLIQKRKKK